jgi:hypothetical protein
MAGLFDDRSPTISYVCFTLILLKDSDLPTDHDPEDRAMLVETTAKGQFTQNANPYLYPLVNSLIVFIWSKRWEGRACPRARFRASREAIEERVEAFLDRPLEGDCPRVQGPGVDATYVKVRRNPRIVSVVGGRGQCRRST